MESCATARGGATGRALGEPLLAAAARGGVGLLLGVPPGVRIVGVVTGPEGGHRLAPRVGTRLRQRTVGLVEPLLHLLAGVLDILDLAEELDPVVPAVRRGGEQAILLVVE